MIEADAQRLLVPGDLVDDREVASAEGDRLSHEQIAVQLAELVRTVPERSNIALYGPWGSGKSGIGNLLREAIEGRDGIRFARFDAFKYAETPLRRNFVSAVASELGINDDLFHDALYAGHTRTDVKVPASKIFKILGIFAGLTLALSAILVGVVALIALLESGRYGADFSSLCKSAVTAGLLPAALLSALITLANKTLQVDRTTAKPDSDEQFEQIFKRLVARAKATRLVIFVDELDRCAADEVVATLDAIRTFLGVARCVFVIAADQRVLEESLTRAARQETPADEVNPYYSTGSAYLDKVFQYQISLPPLMSQRITRFAADLVGNRGGLWQEVNGDYVVSVLVPTHVTSPRRVKHLLNAFALVYRLAQDRHRRGLLAQDPRAHAASMAKLVCLRVEFPLFARDLEIDARLPEMVLRIIADRTDTFDDSYPKRAIERARAYAENHAAPANMIVDSGEADAAASQLEVQSSRQLLDYLSRTRTVPGPNRDLVFMHSTGTAFGLDAQTALAIETAVENADVPAVARRLQSVDPPAREGIVRLLNHLMRTSVGVGAPNAARTLLGLYGEDESLPVGSVADGASEMVAMLADTDPGLLNSDTVDAAWRLAARGSQAGARRLREVILTMIETDGLDASFVLRAPRPALEAKAEIFARIVAYELVRDGGEESVELLSEIDDLTATDVMSTSMEAVSSALRDALDAHKASIDRQSAASATAGRPAGAASTPAPDMFDPGPIVAALAQYARQRAAHSPRLASRIVLTLLKTNRQSGRDAVEKILSWLEPVDEPELVEALLAATVKRRLHAWPQWLAAVEPSATTSVEPAAINQLTAGLWSASKGPGADLATVEAAVAAVAGATDHLPDDRRPNLTEAVMHDVGQPVTDDASAENRSRMLRNLQPLGTAGLLETPRVYRAALSTLSETFAEGMTEKISGDQPLGRYLSRDAVLIVREGTPGNEDAPEQLKDALAGLAACDWLPEPLATELLLNLMDASGLAPGDLGTLPSIEDVVALVEEHGSGASAAAASWVRLAAPDVAGVSRVFAALRESQAVSDAVADAVAKIRATWSRQERVELLRTYIAEPGASVPRPLEARLIGLTDLDANDLATVVIERFSRSTNNTQRRSIVALLAAAALRDTSTRKRLIESIVIPLLRPPNGQPQVGTSEIGLDLLAQIGAPLPHGVKGSLGKAVKAAVAGNDALERRAMKVLQPLGYRIERSGFLGLKRSVDYSG